MARVKTAARSLWHPFEWPAWLGLALLWCYGSLPWRWIHRSGNLLGRIVAPLLRARAHVAKRNLQLCFPEMDDSARAGLLAANLRNTGNLLGEFAFAWMASRDALLRVPARFTGVEHLQQALARGRGVLLAGVHLSHLELCGRLTSQQLAPAPIAGLYREHTSAAFEWAIRRCRLRYADAMFRRNELRGALRWLKAGNILWYAPDQEYKRGESLFVPFFGVPAATLTATHQLAKLSGAAVIGFAHRRLADGSFEISFAPELASFPSSDPRLETERINQLLEAAIRQAPEQYLWLHKRFKTRPPGEAKLYN